MHPAGQLEPGGVTHHLPIRLGNPALKGVRLDVTNVEALGRIIVAGHGGSVACSQRSVIVCAHWANRDGASCSASSHVMQFFSLRAGPNSSNRYIKTTANCATLMT
jgi:hypothetical protein